MTECEKNKLTNLRYWDRYVRLKTPKGSDGDIRVDKPWLVDRRLLRLDRCWGRGRMRWQHWWRGWCGTHRWALYGDCAAGHLHLPCWTHLWPTCLCWKAEQREFYTKNYRYILASLRFEGGGEGIFKLIWVKEKPKSVTLPCLVCFLCSYIHLSQTYNSWSLNIWSVSHSSSFAKSFSLPLDVAQNIYLKSL